MNLYVSNLAYTVTDTDLRVAFEAFGAVTSARVILDRESGRSRGFGFVEMPENHEGQAAIDAINGKELAGRPIRVVEARPKEERPAGGGGGYGNGPRRGGGGGGGGGGYRGGGGGGGGRDDWGNNHGGGGGRDRDRGHRGNKRSGGNEFGGEEGDW